MSYNALFIHFLHIKFVEVTDEFLFVEVTDEFLFVAAME